MAEPTTPEVPKFAGESLVLIDLQRLARADLPKDDLASILMRAYGRREVEDVAPIEEKRCP